MSLCSQFCKVEVEDVLIGRFANRKFDHESVVIDASSTNITLLFQHNLYTDMLALLLKYQSGNLFSCLHSCYCFPCRYDQLFHAGVLQQQMSGVNHELNN